MLNLKSNKGFTLVELLVSMCILAIVMTELMALMFNSSKLYQNGAFEVSLQSEAQQIIQQFEELAIDADTSVSYNEATKTITVSNNSPYNSYEFALSPVAGKSYNDLLLTVNGGTPQIMGEYVRSISLNMANYDDASRAVLVVEMENDKYSYTASKDIYFRNDIGANDAHTSAVVSNACDYDLNVLRYATYDLQSIFEADHTYAFVVEPHPEYFYSGPTKAAIESATAEITTACNVYTSISMNGTSGMNLDPQYEIQSYKWDSTNNKYVPDFTIKLYSEKVCLGIDGVGFAAIPISSTDFDNYYSVQGVSIDPQNINKIDFEICCVADVNGSEVTTNNLEIKAKNTGSYSSVTFINQAWSRNTFFRETIGSFDGSDFAGGTAKDCKPGGMGLEVLSNGTSVLEAHDFALFGTKFKIDVENNDLDCIQNIQYQSMSERVAKWEEFLYKYGSFYICVKFKYAGTMAPSGGMTYELRLYPMPTGAYKYPVSPLDVQGRFFDIAK